MLDDLITVGTVYNIIVYYYVMNEIVIDNRTLFSV